MVFCVFCNQSIIPVKIPVTIAYKTRRRPKVINQSWQLNPQLNLQQGWYALDFDKELRKRKKKKNDRLYRGSVFVSGKIHGIESREFN